MSGHGKLPRRSITEIHDDIGRLKHRADQLSRDGRALVRKTHAMLARTTQALVSSRLVLRQAWSAGGGVVPGDGPDRTPMTRPDRSRTVTIPFGTVCLDADLTLPDAGQGLIVFAHGSGSSRHSPRNRYVARVLEQAGLGTVLVDLLTVEEDQADKLSHQLRFDIPLLARRLTGVIDWLLRQPETAGRPIGLFGASTGAAAALIAAAERSEPVRAVVSRGGRPDLAGEALASVEVPVLLIVGGLDHQVLDLNRQATEELRSPARLEIVLGATHLFEEEDALERVATLARAWFVRHTGVEPPSD
ncbi:dienelactone hydrolase family protein [Flindersiella endophytica]